MKGQREQKKTTRYSFAQEIERYIERERDLYKHKYIVHILSQYRLGYVWIFSIINYTHGSKIRDDNHYKMTKVPYYQASVITV